MRGIVKSIVENHGYVFLRGSNGLDYFCHSGSITNAKIRDLREGDELEFEPVETPRGPRAEAARRIFAEQTA